MGHQADYDAGLDLSIPIGTVTVQSDQMPWKMVSTRVDSATGYNRTVGVYDLSQFNQPYFDRLRTRVLYAVNHGVTPFIMFFVCDDTTMSWSAIGHPYFNGNNINGVNCDTNANYIVEECYTLLDTTAGKQITAYQDSYIRKLVDTLNDIDGIIWEPANEVPSTWRLYDANYRAWVYHVSDVITAHERTGGRKIHPVYLSPLSLIHI